MRLLGAIGGHDQTPANCAARPCLYSLKRAFSAFAALQHASRRFPAAVLQAVLSPPLQGLTKKANCGHRARDSTVQANVVGQQLQVTERWSPFCVCWHLDGALVAQSTLQDATLQAGQLV